MVVVVGATVVLVVLVEVVVVGAAVVLVVVLVEVVVVGFGLAVVVVVGLTFAAVVSGAGSHAASVASAITVATRGAAHRRLIARTIGGWPVPLKRIARNARFAHRGESGN